MTNIHQFKDNLNGGGASIILCSRFDLSFPFDGKDLHLFDDVSACVEKHLLAVSSAISGRTLIYSQDIFSPQEDPLG